jgi:acyl transferase domain-containing protein
VEILLNALGRLWAAGARVDWSGFSAHERRRRVPLPTYPFERQRYWVEPGREAQRPLLRSAPAGVAGIAGKAELADWFYVPHWKPAAPPLPGLAEPQRWLLFLDAAGIGEEVARRLRLAGHAVTTIQAQEGFGRLAGHAYGLDPHRLADYGALAAELKRAGGLPTRIVHLWSAVPGVGTALSGGLFEAAQYLGLYSLLSLVQALGREGAAEPLDVLVVSSGLHAVESGDPVHPEKMPMLAACRVIPQELPHVTFRSLDLDLPEAADGTGSCVTGKAAAAILAEATGAAGASGAVVAYRRGRRWVQAFEPVRLEAGAVPHPVLRHRGVYLITGGLGNIGLLLAAHLARTVQARLVLTSRSPLPEREKWAGVLAAARDEMAVRRIREVQALEALGAEVLAVSADVADREAMETVVVRARARFGDIHGVIHAAGISGEQALASVEETGPAECERQFRSKVRGTITLREVLAGCELDFCVLMSSLSCVLGGLGFTAYAAANLAMDALAHEASRSGDIPWLSVDWDGWEGLGRHAGLAGTAIRPSEGIEAFERVLSLLAESRVVVSCTDLESRIEKWVRLKPGRAAAPPERGLAVPDAGHPGPETETEQAIADLWRQLLGVEWVGLHDDFFELGGDSLLATRLTSLLRRRLNLDLPLRTLFETPTVAGLAARIDQSTARQDEIQILDEVLEAVEGLSDADLDRILSERMGGGEQGGIG